MTCHRLSTYAWLLTLLAGAACRPSAHEPSTQAEAQRVYSQTKWYFAQQRAFWRLVPDPNNLATKDDKQRAIFELPSGTRIIYSEYQPDSGIKAFRGLGRLDSIPEVASPLFRLHSPYTAEHPDTVMLVGFCGDRMFRVEARGTNHQTVLAEAIALATSALAALRDQARYQ